MKSYRLTEVKSYNVPFVRLPRPVFWFNDPFEAGTWSDLHRHEHWGELAFMRSGYMVICTELGNYAAPPQRAVWIPPGLTHEWYIPEPSVDNALYIMPHVLPPGPGFNATTPWRSRPSSANSSTHSPRNPATMRSPAPWPGWFPSCSTSSPCSPKWAFPSPCPAIAASSPCAPPSSMSRDSPETIREWCTQPRRSERTLARLFQRQTGESFGAWRQAYPPAPRPQAQLEAGESVTAVALNCGYASVSAFIAAFKKLFGRTPGQLAR